MKQQQFSYDEVLKMGFKRTDLDDDIFFHENGYHWFLMELRIKNFLFDWEPTDHTIRLIRYEKNLDKDISASRMATIKIKTADQLKLMVEFLTATKNTMLEFPDAPKTQNYV